MDYSVALLFLLGLVLSFYCIGLVYQENEGLSLITISVSVYFTLFVIISGFFFWADRFQMDAVLLTVAIVFLLSCIGMVVIRRKYEFSLHWTKRSPIILLVIFVGFLISFIKFDFFGMGQDQGVYQVKAIALAHGETSQQLAFDEIDKLPTEELRTEATEAVKSCTGFYFFDSSKPTLSEEDKIGNVVGIFHGIPTFPAMLALFTQMFGMSNMQQIQSVFYLCTTFFVLLITECLSLKRSAQILAVSVAAFSPVVQWVMKSALTEGFLGVLYAGILFGLIDRHKHAKYLGVLFIWGFAFFHITIYVMIPLFVVLFLLMYFETHDKQFLVANGIAAIGFAVGITMMCYVSPTYSFMNISNELTFFHSIGEDKVLPFMWGFCAVFIGLSVMAGRFDLQKVYKFITREKFFSWLVRAVMVLVMIFVCIRGYKILMGEVYRMAAEPSSLRLLTLAVFAYGTGIFAFCLTLIKIFSQPQRMLESKESMVIGAAFFYCVLLMSAFIRREVVHTYYYSRYLAPYIVVCAITIGAFLGTYPKRILTLLTICGAVVLLPFNWTLATHKDDSVMEWDIVEDIVEDILPMESENSAIIVDAYRLPLLLTIKTATDLDVFPGLSHFDSQLDYLSEQYDSLYVVAGTPDNLTRYDNNYFNIIYDNKYRESQDLQNNFYQGYIVPFPLDFYKAEHKICILEYAIPRSHYDFSTNDFPIFGTGGVEGKSRWLYESGAGFTAFLKDKDYEMHITLGMGVPTGALGWDSYSVDVYVNDAFAGTMTLRESNPNLEYTVLVPEEIVCEGRNTIRFYAKLWSPTEFGATDARHFTIALSRVDFIDPGGFPVVLDFGEEENFKFTGFSANETTARWTNEAVSQVTTTTLWAETDYTCHVVLGTLLPEICFADGVYDVDVMVNDDLDSLTTIQLTPGESEFSFEIDSRFLSQGENVVSFASNLWSPTDFGSLDTRTLGISIDKIIFEERNG